MKYESLFTCGAVSTVAEGLLWENAKVAGADADFVVYAVHNLLAVLDLTSKRVVRTLKGCTGHITSISYCTMKDASIIIAAASDDGSVWCCSHTPQASLLEWSSFHRLEGLSASTSALHCFTLDNYIIVSAADSKGNVAVWLYDSKATSTMIWSTRLPSAQMAKAVHFSMLPSVSDSVVNIALFVGSVDSRIHIFTADVAVILKSGCQVSDHETATFTSSGAVAGHEEWVTCLSALPVDSKSMYLSSGSQDSKIRVWNIKALSSTIAAPVANDNITNNLAAELDVENEAVEGEVIVETNEDETESEARLQFSAGGVQYAVLLESLLVGHEDWVTAVMWMPTMVGADGQPRYQLFSTSMDRNMVIWSPDASAGGVWVPRVRMGDIGGALGGSIGGNLLGFVGGCTSPSGNSVIGVGYGGSFHWWVLTTSGPESGRWTPVPLSSGHFASVNDLSWSDNEQGDYLVTVSGDQTCRIFAPLSFGAAVSGWKEISRPEIHGYDLNCVALAPYRGVHTLYTAGEEKLIRVFDAPLNVLRGLQLLCSITYPEIGQVNRIEQAYIPELGLSNKAQEHMSKQEQTDQEARSVARINWASEPLESQLSDLTLWPEVNKMFGHTNEVMCMCISKDGRWLASASKARDAATASVLLWTATSSATSGASAHLQLRDRLPGHESTVVCLQFSPDGKYLVSSGKDRGLCLFSFDEQAGTYVPAVCKRSAHKRIVWDCCWTPDSSHVLTTSRDGSCKIWRVTELSESSQHTDLVCVETFSPFSGIAVTAVDVYTPAVDTTQSIAIAATGWLVALGAETGELQVVRINPSLLSAKPCAGDVGESAAAVVSIVAVPEGHCHGATVRRIRWRPRSGGECVEFASCGEDKTVRVHQLVA